MWRYDSWYNSNFKYLLFSILIKKKNVSLIAEIHHSVYYLPNERVINKTNSVSL